jgi:superfamily II DNA/RNA helicase
MKKTSIIMTSETTEYIEEVSDKMKQVIITNQVVSVDSDQTTELPEKIDDFEDMIDILGLELFRAVGEYGLKKPSDIQSRTIHIMKEKYDLIAQAPAGGGKTIAFILGSYCNINVDECYPQVLIVAPTRLLASQIAVVSDVFAKYINVKVSKCIGGYKTQSGNIKEIQKSHVIVGTPGRIYELMSKNVFNGLKINTLIMDEADVLLQSNFWNDIEKIIIHTSKKTQICLFSATFTKDILLLTEKFLHDPYRITVEKEQLSTKQVKQYKVDLENDKQKYGTLKDLFGKLIFTQMIIFVKSVYIAEDLRNKLMAQDIAVGLVHGDMPSDERENVLKEFRLSYLKIMITTDVMCRGIDIDDLRLVINYDMPNDEETYIHRIGRSGRYGGQGVAITFCTFKDSYKINILNREYKLDIQDMPMPEEINEYLVGIKPSDNKVLSSKNYSYD